MTPNKYQKEALRTEGPLPWMKAGDDALRLLNGLMDLNGLAIDILKKQKGCVVLYEKRETE